MSGNPGLDLGATGLSIAICGEIYRGYQFFCEAKSLDTKYQHLIILMQLEQQRFDNFSREAGLHEYSQEVCDSLRIKEPLLLAILQNIRNILDEGAQKYIKYKGYLSSSDLIGDADNIGSGVVERLRIQGLERAPETPLSPSVLRKLRDMGDAALKKVFDGGYLSWGAVDSKAVGELVTQLTMYNTGLVALLDDSQKRHLHSTLDIMCRVLLQRTNSSNELKNMRQFFGHTQRTLDYTDFGLSPADANAYAVVHKREEYFMNKQRAYLQRLTDLKQEYNEGLEKADSPAMNIGFLPLERREFVLRDESRKSKRRFVYFKRKPAWIEWANLGPLSATEDSKAEHQIKLLADLIGHQKPENFRIPPCLGYIKLQSGGGHRYGLVFENPRGSSEVKLRTLQDCISDIQLSPSLSERVALCASITDCIYNLHSIGWIHKSISSENIVFFVAESEKPDFTLPFLLGFQLSRPEMFKNLTRKSVDLGEDIYRHPKARSGALRWHDLYSLALILTEIITWKLLEEFLEISLEEIEKIEGLMTKSLPRIAFAAGDVAAEVVRNCLTAEKLELPVIGDDTSADERLQKLLGEVTNSLQSLSTAMSK